MSEIRCDSLVVVSSDVSVASVEAALEENQIEMLAFKNMEYTAAIGTVLVKARRLLKPTVFLLESEEQIARPYVNLDAYPDDGEFERSERPVLGRRRLLACCDLVLCQDESLVRLAEESGARATIVQPWLDMVEQPKRAIDRLNGKCWQALHPPVSIIRTFHGPGRRELRGDLLPCFEQDYPGSIEIVLLGSDDGGRITDMVNQFLRVRRRLRPGANLPDVRVVHVPAGLDRASIWNFGIEASNGEVLILVDANRTFEHEFVRNHVLAHTLANFDVVVGTVNDPAPGAKTNVPAQSKPARDVGLTPTFINLSARNVSYKRLLAAQNPFDPKKASNRPGDPMHRFEEVDLGYRFYRSGVRIGFLDEPTTPATGHVEDNGVERNSDVMLRLQRMLDEHVELGQVARRWVANVSSELREVVRSVDALDRQAGPCSESRPVRLIGHPRPRVLTYRWHVAHQYELYKLPFDFTLVTGFDRSITEFWDYSQRPMPRNAHFVHKDKVRVRDYDFAILHFDENVLDPENTNGVLDQAWGQAFRWFRDSIELPKIAICHGTPQFHGQYRAPCSPNDLMRPIEASRRRLVEYLGDIPVVCNSHQAAREWMFNKSKVIWHGFDPAEFPPSTGERGILSPLGQSVLSRPHYRGYFLYRKVFDGHFEELRPETLKVPDPDPAFDGNQFAQIKFRNYVDEIRKYKAYFNPTLRSPMPRARAEPMMCGVVTVSANNHDVDMFISNGKNGFYSDDADELREQLRYVLRNPDEARKIGMAGRKLACDIFNIERYLGDWQEMIKDYTGLRPEHRVD